MFENVQYSYSYSPSITVLVLAIKLFAVLVLVLAIKIFTVLVLAIKIFTILILAIKFPCDEVLVLAIRYSYSTLSRLLELSKFYLILSHHCSYCLRTDFVGHHAFLSGAVCLLNFENYCVSFGMFLKSRKFSLKDTIFTWQTQSSCMDGKSAGLY